MIRLKLQTKILIFLYKVASIQNSHLKRTKLVTDGFVCNKTRHMGMQPGINLHCFCAQMFVDITIGLIA